MTINVLFVYGAGNDDMFGGALRDMQADVKAEFGDAIFSPRIIDHTEYVTLVRLLRQWNDPTILIGHSCGCRSITQAALELSMEPIPFLMAIAPSRFCPVAPLPPNVKCATQVTSNPLDVFNLGGAMLLSRSPINNVTDLTAPIVSGLPHLMAPASLEAKKHLKEQVSLALQPAMAGV